MQIKDSALRKRVTVLVAAATLLAGGCGDDDDDAAANPGELDGDFCDQAEEFFEVSQGFDDSQEDFDRAYELMQGMDPPAEIADDWQTVLDLMDDLRDMSDGNIEEIDQNDPAVQEAAAPAGPAMVNIENHVTNECGIDVSG